VPRPDPQVSFSIVHRYFTPFALSLVTLALYISRPADVYAAASYGVLAFSALFNYAADHWSRKQGWLKAVREARLGVNLAANSFLVFLLLPFWRPIWLLFVLTPVATGVYNSRSQTVRMSTALAALLLWAYWVCGLRGKAELAEGAAHAAFIVFISLFVNRVAHETAPGKPAAAAAVRL
jgi:hypothetical protein